MNKSNSRRRFVAARSGVAILGLALSLSPAARASIIVWQTPVAVDVNNASQVVTNGTLVLAVDNNPAATVNGVSFVTPILATNLTGGVAGAFGPNTTTYAQMLSSGVYRSNTGTATITNITSLTIGHQYEVQLFTPFWDNNTYVTQFTDGANSVNMGNTGTTPTFVIGTFTADATTKDISFGAASGTFGLLAAYEVRDLTVPEPSTFALLGLGGLFVWRRMRQTHL